jgi:hypothetical protein
MNIAKVFGRIIGLSAIFATLIVIAFCGLGKTRRVVHARAQDESATTGCTLATITGNYGVLSSFAAYNGGVDATIGILKLTELDGKGKASLTGTSENLSEIVPVTGTGTYTLNSNCAGTMTLDLKVGTTTETVNYIIVVVNNGNQIDIMSELLGNVSTFVANKIN